MKYETLVSRLDKARDKMGEHFPNHKELAFYDGRVGTFQTVMFMPHKDQYKPTLSKLTPDDVVCDMGAGDLRFAFQVAMKCKKVYAVEFNPEIISNALRIIAYDLPRNLIPVCADWRYFPIPKDCTIITCLVNIPGDLLPDEWFEDGRKVLLGIRSINKSQLIELIDPEQVAEEI